MPALISHLREVVQRYSATRANLVPILNPEVVQALDAIHSHEHEIEELQRTICDPWHRKRP